jgi:valyl-tRNA synthetase
MSEAFLSYRYNDAASSAYEYFWNDFCDWYVEATKLSTKSTDASLADVNKEKDRAATILLDVLVKSLQLLHPLLPFVTEEIYRKLPDEARQNAADMLITSAYPEYDERLSFPKVEKIFGDLQSLIGLVRTLRSECGIPPDKKLHTIIQTGGALAEAFGENDGLIKLLAGIGELEIKPSAGRPSGSIGMAGNGFEVFVFVAGAVDTAALKKKFLHDLEKDQKYIDSLRGKLANEQFIKNAPEQLVEEQKVKLEETLKRTEKFANYLRDI